MNTKGKKIRLVVYTVIYIIMLFLFRNIRIIFRAGYLNIFGFKFHVSTVMGSLNTVLMLLSIGLTLANWMYGSIIALVLNTLSLINPINMLFVIHNMESIPGILMASNTYIFILVLRNRLRLIDANNRFYQQISVTDSLTKLPNRRGMRENVAKLIRNKKPFYLLFVDLDNFKFINDSIGHNVGDMVLQTVASNTCMVPNEGGLVARNGGDEFIIVIRDNGNVDILERAKEYLTAISKKIWIEDIQKNCNVYASIGIAHYPNDATNIDDILNFADTAMYEAKKDGKNKAVLFNSDMAELYIHDRIMEEQIRKGLRHNQFYLCYQPQYNARNHKLRGFEALLRFKDESGKEINPCEFTAVAEQSDLIIQIDKFVLTYVMNQFKDIANKSNNSFLVSVNISAKHISEGDFINDIKQILKETGYPPKCLEIEITEYCMIRDMEAATQTMQKLHEIGIGIALDDFGTGYASLSTLTKLPINLLKIDKSFIDNLNMNETNDDFVEAIISMGHLLHCDIISEGVETTRQLKLLTEAHCDYIQGYVWGKPVSYEEAVAIYEEEEYEKDEE